MKKNWTMRVAVLMVALTLITACFVSGTFAKYVRSGAGEDNARVAKFGVAITGHSDLFKTQYETDDTDYSGTYSVESSNTDRLVAPGTNGTLTAFDLTGTPEVAVRVNYTVDSFTLANWTINTEFYCPLTITVDGTDFCGLDYADADTFIADITDAIEDATYDYDANTDLSAQAADDLDISWAWAFEDATGSENNQTDVKDTYLGDRAAEGAAATIALKVTCTVTQID